MKKNKMENQSKGFDIINHLSSFLSKFSIDQNPVGSTIKSKTRSKKVISDPWTYFWYGIFFGYLLLSLLGPVLACLILFGRILWTGQEIPTPFGYQSLKGIAFKLLEFILDTTKTVVSSKNLPNKKKKKE